MDKSKNNYKYIIAVSSFILMAVAFSIVNSVNTILTAPVINARNFSIGEFSTIYNNSNNSSNMLTFSRKSSK